MANGRPSSAEGATAGDVPPFAQGFIAHGESVVHSGPVDVREEIKLGSLNGKVIVITGGKSEGQVLIVW